MRAPLLLFRRGSSSSSRQGGEEQQPRRTTTAGAGGGGRGKAGTARRRGSTNAPAAAAAEPQQEEEEAPKNPAAGTSLKSLVNASRSGGGASGSGGGSGTPQPPPSASSSPLHLSWLKGHGDGISSVAFSADGAFLLTASRDRALRQWPFPSPSSSSSSAKETPPLRRGAQPTPAQPRSRALHVSPLAASYLAGDASKGIVVLSRDGLNGPTLTAIPAFGSGGKNSDAPAALWEAGPLPLINGRRPVALLCSSSSSSSKSSPSPLVAVVSERTELETFDAATGRRTAAVDTGGLRTHGACCCSVGAEGGSGALFAVATFASDAKVYFFDGGNGESGSKAPSVQKAGWTLSHSSQVLAVSLSRDGTRAATSSRDGTWASWKTPGKKSNSASGERTEATKLGSWKQDLPPEDFYRLLALSPDGSVLAAAAGGDLHFLCSGSGALLGAVSPAHGGEVTTLCWSPQKKKVAGLEGGLEEEKWVLASGGDDRAVRLWVAPEAGGDGSGWQRG